MTDIQGLYGVSAAQRPSGDIFQNISIGPHAKVHIGHSYHIKQENPLDHLPCAARVSFNSSRGDQEVECLAGTRQGVLRQIQEWVDGQSKACIFWLNGAAGRGKSTIARTIARTYYDKRQLGASFFFSRGASHDASNATKFFTTIAAQLARAHPSLKSAITEVVEGNKNVAGETLRDQWNQLILRTLEAISPEIGPAPWVLVLVIDALDECDSDRAVTEVLGLLAGARSITTVQLRILITSRPEAHISKAFGAMPEGVCEKLALDDIPRGVVDEDMSLFFRDRFKGIVESSENLAADWPGEAKISLLVQQAAGLFIYAATVCRFIQENGHWPPTQLLAVFLPDERNKQSRTRKLSPPSGSPTADLDNLYTTVLEHWTNGVQTTQDEEVLIENLKLVLGSLILLFEPLSTSSLAGLLDFDQDTIHAMLRLLRSVLQVPEDPDLPITLIHPSFREFLINKNRCRKEKYLINETAAHCQLAQHCLGRLTREGVGLKEDICNLKAPGTHMAHVGAVRVACHIPPDMQYACLHWVQHLSAGKTVVQDDHQSHKFLREHLLHWLEAMSLIGRFPEVVAAILTLRSLVTAGQSPDMYAFVQDARRFILHNRFVEKVPLQVYCSALMFSPENSVVRRQFRDQIPSWVKTLPLVDRDWDQTLQILEGHRGAVFNVKFSPDGGLLASGSKDSTVKLWDPMTGALRSTLRGHSASVEWVAFSPPSGQFLASASDDGTVKLWNPVDGTLSRTLTAGPGRVRGMCFSPDGQVLASASGLTISLWDHKSGTSSCSFQGTRDEDYLFNSLSFSPNGQLLASATERYTVVLWDLATGSRHGTLRNEWLDDISCMEFSPADNTILACGCGEGMINIWDTEKRVRRHNLNDRIGPVRAVAFSPDGSLLASGGHCQDVMLWDPRLGTLVAVINRHWQFDITGLAFSSNGKFLAGGCGITVRFWDLTAGVGKPESRVSESNLVCRMVFSPDGQTVATVSEVSSTLKLWNSATGKSWATLAGNNRFDRAVAFSPDGQLLARGSRSTIVLRKIQTAKVCLLWEIQTTKVHHMLCGHSGSINALTFSPTGRLLASAGHDKTVRLWNPETGVVLHVLQCRWTYVTAVAFSPDSRKIAGCSYDSHRLPADIRSNIRLWDVQTGGKLQELEVDGSVVLCSFDREGSNLETNLGIIEFPLPILCEQLGCPLPPPSAIEVVGGRVWCGEEAVLWLPQSYKSVASKDGVIALAYDSDRVMFTRIDEKEVPRSTSERPGLFSLLRGSEARGGLGRASISRV